MGLIDEVGEGEKAGEEVVEWDLLHQILLIVTAAGWWWGCSEFGFG